ncbi:hypothetical protein CBR_g49252 [Chara braunii]|uniref:Uncharacterized protein n=1 Tax=Chara braunii TaxID=69332 RepID=A0A388M4I5_CHABU|nr:hypothetical protein CBR_g49252 [Chara braunii]|eukprot:GBG89461.1 hypothetical protein CBR_g49252 [Chara braunii]
MAVSFPLALQEELRRRGEEVEQCDDESSVKAMNERLVMKRMTLYMKVGARLLFIHSSEDWLLMLISIESVFCSSPFAAYTYPRTLQIATLKLRMVPSRDLVHEGGPGHRALRHRVLKKVLACEVVWVQAGSLALAKLGKLSVQEMVHWVKCDRVLVRLWNYYHFKHDKRPDADWSERCPFLKSRSAIFRQFESRGLDAELWDGSRKYVIDSSLFKDCPPYMGCDDDKSIEATEKSVGHKKLSVDWSNKVLSVLTGSRLKSHEIALAEGIVHIKWEDTGDVTSIAPFGNDPLDADIRSAEVKEAVAATKSHTFVLDLCEPVDLKLFKPQTFDTLDSQLQTWCPSHWMLVVFVLREQNLSFLATMNHLSFVKLLEGKWVRRSQQKKSFPVGNNLYMGDDRMYILFKGDDLCANTSTVYEGKLSAGAAAAVQLPQKVTQTDVSDIPFNPCDWSHTSPARRGSVYGDMERNPAPFVNLLESVTKKGEGVVFLGKPHARSLWEVLKAGRHVIAMEGNSKLLQFTIDLVKSEVNSGAHNCEFMVVTETRAHAWNNKKDMWFKLSARKQNKIYDFLFLQTRPKKDTDVEYLRRKDHIFTLLDNYHDASRMNAKTFLERLHSLSFVESEEELTFGSYSSLISTEDEVTTCIEFDATADEEGSDTESLDLQYDPHPAQHTTGSSLAGPSTSPASLVSPMVNPAPGTTPMKLLQRLQALASGHRSLRPRSDILPDHLSWKDANIHFLPEPQSRSTEADWGHDMIWHPGVIQPAIQKGGENEGDKAGDGKGVSPGSEGRSHGDTTTAEGGGRVAGEAFGRQQSTGPGSEGSAQSANVPTSSAGSVMAALVALRAGSVETFKSTGIRTSMRAERTKRTDAQSWSGAGVASRDPKIDSGVVRDGNAPPAGRVVTRGSPGPKPGYTENIVRKTTTTMTRHWIWRHRWSQAFRHRFNEARVAVSLTKPSVRIDVEEVIDGILDDHHMSAQPSSTPGVDDPLHIKPSAGSVVAFSPTNSPMLLPTIASEGEGEIGERQDVTSPKKIAADTQALNVFALPAPTSPIKERRDKPADCLCFDIASIYSAIVLIRLIKQVIVVCLYLMAYVRILHRTTEALEDYISRPPRNVHQNVIERGYVVDPLVRHVHKSCVLDLYLVDEDLPFMVTLFDFHHPLADMMNNTRQGCSHPRLLDQLHASAKRQARGIMHTSTRELQEYIDDNDKDLKANVGQKGIVVDFVLRQREEQRMMDIFLANIDEAGAVEAVNAVLTTGYGETRNDILPLLRKGTVYDCSELYVPPFRGEMLTFIRTTTHKRFGSPTIICFNNSVHSLQPQRQLLLS